MNKKTKIIAGITALFVLIILILSFTIIPSGHRGVVTHFGKVQEQILDEGIHLVIPIVTNVHKISLRVFKAEEQTDAASRDIQKVHAKLALNWHVKADGLVHMYQNIGDIEDVESKIIAPAVSEVLKAATAQLSAEEILAKRIHLKEMIDEALIKRLSQYNIIVDDVSLTNLDFTSEFNKAVEEKQIAEQEAQRAVYIKQKATQEALAAIEIAKGQAEAQKLMRVSLTDQGLQLKAIEKWDGQFPQVMGQGTLPFINFKLKDSTVNNH